ncbi:arrestin domain-containing protein [Moniliophthora roreri MCA 2997]|uniref:Arrestin domain-containing protein n=2 Tax=Moniliophthora roreri TaxID=221103 RepID=V2WMW6_MONRO|nr:arrestin domain-containing protein [Moniliophthora roreri MCA 2997]KAI3609586.1 arrestin domain-containing protein [Moniliophthora roreri]
MSFVPNDSPTPPEDHHEGPSLFDFDSHSTMLPKEKDRPRLEILLDKECIELKGTGVDVEPAWLSGHVALYLTESTSIKEITLVFRGKARLPVPNHESLSLNSSPLTYIVCNHEWSFLEGSKGHSHTLKAGKHYFPFQLQLGGSLPSTLSTSLYGGASIAYKLRAHAVRPGLSHNLTSVLPVTLLRGFGPEALEYQQTLEIENTWPEKLMYSLMIPHKAWAAGDTITALVKFSPLLKGVGVLNINTTIHETVKIYARGGGYQEHSRVVGSSKHEIIGGKAVEVREASSSWNKPYTPASTSSGHGTPFSAYRSTTSSGGSYFTFNPHPNTPSSFTGHAPPTLPSDQPEAGSSTAAVLPPPALHTPPLPSGFELSHDDVVTYLTTPLRPHSITPTHGLDPIQVSHRIRWSILILNPDGHTSELRCSLPLHLLDWRLLDEARAHTAATRRLLIGGHEGDEEGEKENELPSYNAHVRDRVANMYLPESATMRVPLGAWSPSGARSGASSPMEGPGELDSNSLDWVNSELLLSIGDHHEEASSRTQLRNDHAPSQASSNSNSHPHSPLPTPPDSRPASRGRTSRSHSTSTSRRPSPERHHHHHESEVAANGGTYVHSGNQASRSVHQLFKASMKPFTSISSSFGLGSRSGSHGNLTSLVSHHTSSSPYAHHSSATSSRPGSSHGHSAHSSSQVLPPGSGAISLPSASPRALDLNTVPDYQTASRGFIGGVPPLSSMRGLPTYEESNSTAQRPGGSGSEMERAQGADLTSRFDAMTTISASS